MQAADIEQVAGAEGRAGRVCTAVGSTLFVLADRLCQAQAGSRQALWLLCHALPRLVPLPQNCSMIGCHWPPGCARSQDAGRLKSSREPRAAHAKGFCLASPYLISVCRPNHHSHGSLMQCSWPMFSNPHHDSADPAISAGASLPLKLCLHLGLHQRMVQCRTSFASLSPLPSAHHSSQSSSPLPLTAVCKGVGSCSLLTAF